jgi:polynucleotide 5'-hydroxyl-kinase GRC3/NOL9
MKYTVEAGKTLLVDGPASISVTAGKTEVFGSLLKIDKRIVIREGKRLPFFIEEKADLDISLGKNASLSEVGGNTIPRSWVEAFESLRFSGEKPVVAMVLGRTDSGKSSFCTYLANKLIGEKRKTAILDGDMGQSDVGPPGTVAYAFLTKPVTDLFKLKEDNAYFVGVTSPSKAMDEVIKGMALMKAEILSKEAEFVLVNTDGWVEGEAAMDYKLRLAKEVDVKIVFHLRQEGELTPPMVELENFMKYEITTSPEVMQRSTEKRKDLREMGYAKYLAIAKTKTFPTRLITTGELKTALNGQSEEGGLILGLYGSQQRFLGIGILRSVDCARKILKVFTSVSTEPSCIVLGKIRLDKNLKEVPFSQDDATTAQDTLI